MWDAIFLPCLFFADYSHHQGYQQQPTAAVGQVTSTTAQTQPAAYPGYQQAPYQFPSTSSISSASYGSMAGYHGQMGYSTAYGAPIADMSSYASSQSGYSTTTTTTQVIDNLTGCVSILVMSVSVCDLWRAKGTKQKYSC